MRRLVVVGTVLLVVGFVAGRLWQQMPVSAEGQGGRTPSGNGDVNGDGTLDIADAVYIIDCQLRGGPPPVPLSCLPLALPATGQTKCYDNAFNEIDCANTDFPGQDGFYQGGCPTEGRFVDNVDGTVTDTCTGLMWQKDTTDVNGDGQISKEWNGGDLVTWQAALQYCEGLSFAGQDDWRLPNVRELQSIAYYGRRIPSIDPVFAALIGSYWSSSSVESYPVHAWLVNFDAGEVLDLKDKTGICYVRAVRNVR